MLDPTYRAVLRVIAQRLQDTSINWVVTGSCGFALQGLAVAVHDIDLQTDAAGAYAVERLFADQSTRKVSFSASERIRSHFGALVIDGIQVEIMGDIQKRLGDGTWEAPVDISRYKRWVALDGMRIPVLALEYEYEAYLKLGRIEKAEMLRRWLQNRVTS